MPDRLSEDLASLRIDRERDERPRRPIVLRVVAAVAIVGALGGGAAIAWPYAESAVFRTEVRTAEIYTLTPAQASTVLTATGFVEPVVHSTVSALVPGRIARVHVQEGALVAEGDLLVELDASDQEAAIASARARVAAAQARVLAATATVAEAEQQITRLRPLVAGGAAARSQLDDLAARRAALSATVDASRAEVRAAQAEVAALEVGRTRMTIVAPIAGTVITDPADVGEMVGPQTAVLEIADLTSLEVEIDVPENRISMAQPGTPCEISLDAFPGRRFRGEVRDVSRRVNRAKAAIPVKVRFADGLEGVLPDMSARVSFLRDALSDEELAAAERTVVPRAAVIERGGRQVVFVVRDGKVHVEDVEVGEELDDGYELVRGPEVGTKVVLDPPRTLSDGHSVSTGDEDEEG